MVSSCRAISRSLSAIAVCESSPHERFRSRSRRRSQRQAFRIRLFSSTQQQRTLIELFSQPRIFLLQAPALGFDQNQPRRQSLDLSRDFAFALFDLAQLLLLIDALTRLSISSQHRFRRRGTRGRQFIFEVASFLSCRTCSFFSLTQIVRDSELQFADL